MASARRLGGTQRPAGGGLFGRECCSSSALRSSPCGQDATKALAVERFQKSKDCNVGRWQRSRAVRAAEVASPHRPREHTRPVRREEEVLLAHRRRWPPHQHPRASRKSLRGWGGGREAPAGGAGPWGAAPIAGKHRQPGAVIRDATGLLPRPSSGFARHAFPLESAQDAAPWRAGRTSPGRRASPWPLPTWPGSPWR